MPTRRELLEAACVMERTELWTDLVDAYEEDPFSSQTASLVRRIRLVSEALGYPTTPDAIPMRYWRLYHEVESVAALGIYAKSIDFSLIEDHHDRIPHVPSDVREALRWRTT